MENYENYLLYKEMAAMKDACSYLNKSALNVGNLFCIHLNAVVLRLLNCTYNYNFFLMKDL